MENESWGLVQRCGEWGGRLAFAFRIKCPSSCWSVFRGEKRLHCGSSGAGRRQMKCGHRTHALMDPFMRGWNIQIFSGIFIFLAVKLMDRFSSSKNAHCAVLEFTFLLPLVFHRGLIYWDQRLTARWLG